MQLPDTWRNTSISHGTMIAEDIVDAITRTIPDPYLAPIDAAITEFNCLRSFDADCRIPDKYAENASYILNEDIWDHLNSIAPEGCYFGSHPGDGADYGFWECEEEAST